MKPLISSFSFLSFSLACVALIPAMMLGYWAIDRKLPIEHLTGQFVKWESITPHIVIIQWSAHRNRLCFGQTTSTVFAGKEIDLPSGPLPHKNAAQQIGPGAVRWTESIVMPDEAFDTEERNILLSVRFTWKCNPLQDYWPLELDAPPITIPVPQEPS